MHRSTWAEINLDSIETNIRSFRSLIEPSEALIAVVKADGYGHGAEYVAHAALKAGANRLAVAILEEGVFSGFIADKSSFVIQGIALRRSNIIPKDIDIHVLGLTAPGLEKATLENRLIPTIEDVSSLIRFGKAAESLGIKSKTRYHLKIDTGMGRIGLPSGDISNFLSECSSKLKSQTSICSRMEMEGVFTHFSKADEKDKSYTKNQIVNFMNCIKQIRSYDQLSHNLKYIHTSNSAGLIDSHLLHDKNLERITNAFRVGISMYGYYPSSDVDLSSLPKPLQPCMNWKTKIIQLKKLEPGHALSYGGEYVTHRDPHSLIATLPIGYADGFRRKLGASNPNSKDLKSFHVLVRGHLCPIVGRVCMDMTMIDVTSVPGVSVEDEVVLIGKQGKYEITVDDMASHLQTINYEIATSVGQRVPRVYYYGGKPVAIKSLIMDETTL